MFDITGYSDQVDDELSKKVEDHAAAVLTELMDEIDNRGLELVLVTNEVGLSIVPENQIARVFRDIQGRINQRLAKRADEVYLVCAGIPVKIK
jgi:adenosylcobinamide kinase/adenosylcobinamide-phosphate guanylyltransferase